MRVKFVVAVVLLAAGGAAVWWWTQNGNQQREQYVTQPVDRGPIVQAITANGTLNPVILVNVGTQISGTVKTLQADFNQRVEAGQILAELDPALIEADIAKSRAELASAEAGLRLAQVRERRNRELVAKGFVNQAQLDDSIKEREAADAQVRAARAALDRQQVNLRYSVIRSPISGIVVARNVDIGQTVAASFQTPVLFQIAKDLKQMQIYASVAEADVGAIRIGQTVRFTVDAYPEREFTGTVSQIRLNPTVQQNVVTYNVVVSAANDEEILLPGMTANVQITLRTREDVLRVPNAALRFVPDADSARPKAGGGKTVYKLDRKGVLVPVEVRTGAADSAYTEIVAGNLGPGDGVVVRHAASAKKKSPSPFRFRP
ncbi:MAG: efflux RND transporter periplasmic adaptor subunit [Pseudomonadota bacterium]